MMQSDLIDWTLSSISAKQNSFSAPHDMRAAVAQIKALPPLPGSASRIFELLGDPDASVAKLAEVIEMDPLLTAQVIRWASSALYGYRGQISSVHDAIVRVLGFDFVMNLALGLAVLAPLKSPGQGPIGTRMFWLQALASTRLMARLAENMPAEDRPEAKAVFFAGLLHNIGFPLLGHEFSEEFNYLTGLIEANPGLTVFNLERFALGVNHTEMGAWLMSIWSMPRPIIDVVYHHHNPNYRGENYRLNLLTFLSDCLLGQLGIGDAINQPCPEDVPRLLGLEVAVCQAILDSQNQELPQIRAIVESFQA